MVNQPPGILAHLQGSGVPTVGFRLAEHPMLALERNTMSPDRWSGFLRGICLLYLLQMSLKS